MAPPQQRESKRKRKRKRKWKEDGAPTKKRKIDREAAENDEHRLGLVAQLPSDDPLAQQLQAKLDPGRRKKARSVAESAGSRKKAYDSEDDPIETEQESCFGKKKRTPQILKTDTAHKLTKIWWDIENAGIPYDLCNSDLYQRIVQKLRDEGFTGPVEMSGIVGYIDSSVPEDLDERIKIKYAKSFNKPPGKEDQAADMEIVDLINEWIETQDEPANAMIISGDNGFQDSFEALARAGHTTLLSYRADKNQKKTSEKVKNAAMYKWPWRPFLSLPEDSINKKTRSAEFEARKKAMKKEGEKEEGGCVRRRLSLSLRREEE